MFFADFVHYYSVPMAVILLVVLAASINRAFLKAATKNPGNCERCCGHFIWRNEDDICHRCLSEMRDPGKQGPLSSS